MKLLEAKRAIKGKIRVPYYYVPSCPYCGSIKTGRIIKYKREVDMDYEMIVSFKNGELVVPIDSTGPENCCCTNCGYIWYSFIKLSFISLAERDRERARRGAMHLYAEKRAQIRQDKKKAGVIGRLFREIQRF